MRAIMRRAPCQPSCSIWIVLRKDAPPKRGLKAMHGERGAFPRAPRPAGFGFVMVPYRSLPLVIAQVICVQSRRYHRSVRTSSGPPPKYSEFLAASRSESDETKLKPFFGFDETTFRLSV